MRRRWNCKIWLNQNWNFRYTFDRFLTTRTVLTGPITNDYDDIYLVDLGKDAGATTSGSALAGGCLCRERVMI